MKKLIVLIAAALIAAPALAIGLGNDNPGLLGGDNTNTNLNGNTNLNNNTNQQGQAQGQAQGQGQLQGQGQGQSMAQGQATNVGVGIDVSNRISNDVRQNAAAFSGSKSDANSNSVSDAKSNSVSGAISGSVSGGGDAKSSSVSAGGKAGALAGSNSGGNTLTVNEAAPPADTSVRYSGSYTVKGVPNVVTGAVYPTAPCMGSSSIGGSGVGFGVSIGHTWKDVDCSVRETARSFVGMGLKEDALHVLCSSEHAFAAPSCKALAPKVEQQPAAQ